MSALLGKLEALYGQGDETAAGFRLTDRGIWHATPLAVLAAAVPLVAETGLLVAGGRPAQVFDAGAGDGRLLAALALGLPPTFERLLWGLESDATLAATARSKLSTLNHPVRVAEGDFLDPRAYEDLGLRPRDLEVVVSQSVYVSPQLPSRVFPVAGIESCAPLVKVQRGRPEPAKHMGVPPKEQRARLQRRNCSHESSGKS